MQTSDIRSTVEGYRRDWEDHLTRELLPFWFSRALDQHAGGFITQFDGHGLDAGTDEKSLIAQARMTYAMSAAARAGYERERCRAFARHGLDYLLERMWDKEYGGFYWMTDRAGRVTTDAKVVYGQSFGIYALSEYYLAFGEPEALHYARRCFELLLTHAADVRYGGFFEMFRRDWTLAGLGAAGGDRKTLDAHMHLMESFTALLLAGGDDACRRHLEEVVALLTGVIYSPETGAGTPQFSPDWRPAPQIKFDIIWGWDRFNPQGVKAHATDNFSYGHDMEFFWLLREALRALQHGHAAHLPLIQAILERTLAFGIDREHGGVYVEGPVRGEAHDRQKEFWQQAETLIGLLEAYHDFGEERFLKAYALVHRFVFERMIAHDLGEWLPLLEPDGTPVWTHMGTSWKINYHTVRCALLCIKRLDEILKQNLA